METSTSLKDKNRGRWRKRSIGNNWGKIQILEPGLAMSSVGIPSVLLKGDSDTERIQLRDKRKSR